MSCTPQTAFILQVHKNPDQVNLFINQLISEGEADVFVHIDKKHHEKLRKEILENKSVKILQESIDCLWGDISQVDTTILLLREVLASNKKYDFICLRSGQDLLVKNGFKEFLLNYQDKIFISLRDLSERNLALMKIKWPKMTRNRYSTTHPYRIYRRLILSLYRQGINLFRNSSYWPEEFVLYSGSQWFTITYDAAKYIIDFLDANPWYYIYFKNTLCPDEWFFNTLIMNSHLKKNVINNNLVFLQWGEKYEANSPKFLDIGDVKRIEESGSFFARKFDQDIDANVVEYFSNLVTFGRSEILISK